MARTFLSDDKVNLGPAAANNTEEWLWDLEEDAPKVEVRNGDASNHGLEQRNTHS